MVNKINNLTGVIIIYTIEGVNQGIDNMVEDIRNEINEKSTYIEMIKYIIDSFYGKETIFYLDKGKWYSREHCKEIGLKELNDFLFDTINKLI